MIAFVTGKLVSKQPPWIVLDVAGVGYELEVSMSTFFQLPELGQHIRVLTHLVVREDAHLLYGFHSEAERDMFRTLLRVNGVGAKLALSVLSTMEAEQLAQAVHHGDTAALVKVPGIGKKTAERLLVELRDRVDAPGGAPAAQAALGAARPQPQGAVAEATSALVALGYKPAEAERMIGALDAEGASTEGLIRQALRGRE